MFAMPLLVGLGAAHAPNELTALFALGAFCFFLLRYPPMLAIKSRAPDTRRNALRWSAIYAVVAGISGAWLLFASRLWALILLGAIGLAALAIYLLLAAPRAEMSAVGEWIGIARLALGGPGAHLVSTGTLDPTALALYALNLLYLGGTISYIKFKVREQPGAVASVASFGAQLWAGRATLAYHAMLLLLGAALAAIGFVPALAAAAFLLPMCKVFAGVATRPARLNLPRLGFIELGSQSHLRSSCSRRTVELKRPSGFREPGRSLGHPRCVRNACCFLGIAARGFSSNVSISPANSRN